MKPLIQVDDVLREMTDEEYERFLLIVNSPLKDGTNGDRSLDGKALIATLNAVLGLWSLHDAANIAGLPEQDLINEALAWGVAANMGNYE